MKSVKALNLFSAVAAITLAATAKAVTLTGVPMQGGMVMPMLRYDAQLGRVQVTMPSTVPTLTPLLVSNPSDWFDPADPWFTALDPSAQGASFSRRYGFMWDSLMSDALPANTEVWIRKLSSDAGLNVYRYAEFEPKAFEPIFGTSGSTNAMSWNRVMFHPCFTAGPGTNTFVAEFEVYLVSTISGQGIPNSGTGSLAFNFHNLPDGRPELALVLGLEGQAVLGWPANTATNWVLECAGGANAPSWTTVTNPPVHGESQTEVQLDCDAPHQFFRMRYIP